MNWHRVRSAPSCLRLACLTGVMALTAGPLNAENFALIIGVNDCPQFRLPDGSRPRALRGAESDAQSVARLLTSKFKWPESQVHLLLGEEATRSAIEKQLSSSIDRADRKDSFVLYFAGHGTQVADQRPLDEEDRLDEALCPADVTSDGKNLILDDDLGRWLEECKAEKITVVLDCCHSGTGIKDVDDDIAARWLPMMTVRVPITDEDRDGLWQDLRGTSKSLEPRSLIALFACRPEQQAYERRFSNQMAPARSGQFTRHLLEGLAKHSADKDKDGTATSHEVSAYVKRQLDDSFNDARPLDSERQEPLLEVQGADRAIFPDVPEK